MARAIDELGLIGRQLISYEEYFDIMDLTDDEKKKRSALAERFEILILFFFLAYAQKQEIDFEKMIYEKYIEIAMEFLEVKAIPDYIDKHARQVAKDIVRVTMEHDGEEFYTSKDRGMLIGANEANAVGNYNQQIQAVKSGKKYKTWVTENDYKVRHTHKEVDGMKINIFEPFQVGNSLMMFPHDQETFGASPEEIINCRCTLVYS